MIRLATITITQAVRLAAGIYNVPADTLRSRSRRAEVAEPRQLAVFFAFRAGHTCRMIQIYFRYRDHSAVPHACGAVRDRMDTMPTFKARVEETLAKINPQEKAA
jgi:chromosomal replication initiator protein